jgi:hypothetical protein
VLAVQAQLQMLLMVLQVPTLFFLLLLLLVEVVVVRECRVLVRQTVLAVVLEAVEAEHTMVQEQELVEQVTHHQQVRHKAIQVETVMLKLA